MGGRIVFNIKAAVERYRVARLFDLPTKICIKVFLFGKGRPIENLEKMTKKEKSNE